MITFLSAIQMPGGFNPETGTFDSIKPVIEIPRNRSSQTTTSTYVSAGLYRRKRSLFSRFSDSIEDIGNWFADHSDSVIGWTSMIVMGLIILGGIITVIAAWVNEGFWMALLTAVIAVIVCGIAVTVASIAITIVVNVVMYALRFIFWNGWTFLIAIALIGGGIAYAAIAKDSSFGKAAIEAVVAPHDRYQCTAKVLNVRQAPSKNARVLGTLKKGETVEVKEIKDGFALIDFKGKDGYASLQYLTKVD